MSNLNRSLSARAFHLQICIVLFIFMSAACSKIDWRRGNPKADDYPADVAIAWMNMQLRLTKGSPGFNSIVANRSYAYVGLSLYESIAPGIPGCQSIASQLQGGLVLHAKEHGKDYYWPASANAALAYISKKIFANAPAPLISAIDSLEHAFNEKFMHKAKPGELERSRLFGKKIAETIFNWSKSDGGHEAYIHLTDDSYQPPTGAGKWVPTAPAFGKPFHPHWGTNRSFLPQLLLKAQAAPPPAYSEKQSSDFYKAANHVYLTSTHLSAEDSVMVRFWADLPANYNVPAHATNILTQLIQMKKLSLPEAAILYCKHGIAGNESLIVCFASKYKYNLVRPITYIRNVIGKPTWNPVIPSPPFPEYTSAHAVVSTAFATVLEEHFGKKFSFTDNTYQGLYPARTFKSFEHYAEEAATSRVYGGIHYAFAATEGMKQGRIVGKEVNRLKFKK